MYLADEFIRIISEKDILQSKYLRNLQLTAEERNEFEDWLRFYLGEQGLSMDEITDAYIFLNKMVLEETKYFYKYGHYRYSTVAEVEELVYANCEFMSKYMIGLSCSEFLWYPHLAMIRYFKSKLIEGIMRMGGQRYLEIGPGGGQYLVKAISSGLFCEYKAVDISPTSVALSNAILKYKGMDIICTVEEKDFFALSDEEKYDCVVMGEVLEHVERPREMLEAIRECLTPDGVAFITTVITAPTIDHIYLFDDESSVLSMAKDAGYEVMDYMCATANNVSMETAVKRKMAIDIAMILKKRNS